MPLFNPISSPVGSPAPALQRIEWNAAKTRPQGTATVVWSPNLTGALLQLSPLVELGGWSAPDPAVARAVRVSFLPQSASPPTLAAHVTYPGAMALIQYTGQNGLQLSRWVGCPAEVNLRASSVRVQALAVGLPYQALPTCCNVNPTTHPISVPVAVTFTEGASDDAWPSLPLYPLAGIPLTGQMPTAGPAPLCLTLNQGFAASVPVPGFLRSVQITNTNTSTIFLCCSDNPFLNTMSAADFVNFPSFGPIAVPGGSVTVVRGLDDRPFFWGPVLAALSSLSTPAFANGDNVYVEAEYAPIAAPGF